jgi:hypothetical protein
MMVQEMIQVLVIELGHRVELVELVLAHILGTCTCEHFGAWSWSHAWVSHGLTLGGRARGAPLAFSQLPNRPTAHWNRVLIHEEG